MEKKKVIISFLIQQLDVVLKDVSTGVLVSLDFSQYENFSNLCNSLHMKTTNASSSSSSSGSNSRPDIQKNDYIDQHAHHVVADVNAIVSRKRKPVDKPDKSVSSDKNKKTKKCVDDNTKKKKSQDDDTDHEQLKCLYNIRKYDKKRPVVKLQFKFDSHFDIEDVLSVYRSIVASWAMSDRLMHEEKKKRHAATKQSKNRYKNGFTYDGAITEMDKDVAKQYARLKRMKCGIITKQNRFKLPTKTSR